MTIARNQNPYYLRYGILVNSKQRGDAMFAAGEPKLDETAEQYEVSATENDISHECNQSTKELAVELKLFACGDADEDDEDLEDIEIKSRA